MKRVFTATCLAATFAVGLAAQSTTSSQTKTPPAGGQRGGPRTVTGCLRAGDTADSYMLTDVQMQGGGGRPGDTTAGSTATGGTTPGTTTGSTGTAPQGGRAMAPMSMMLVPASGVDLKPHVGHKIEVTGTLTGGRGGAGRPTTGGSATGTATGTTAGGTTTGGTTTASGSATGTGTGASATGGGQGGGRGPRSMKVTSVRMISESCS
jgi:hypothetical protein